MKYTVTSTKQISEIFPELPKTDKFKRKLDEVFELGFQFDFLVAKDMRVFEGKNNDFKSKICFDGRSFLLKKTRIKDTVATEAEYISHKASFISFNYKHKSVCTKVGSDEQMYHCVKEVTEDLKWSQLVSCAGKLIKDKLTVTCQCGKCGGTGRIPQYAHRDGGICYSCAGIGKWLSVS